MQSTTYLDIPVTHTLRRLRRRITWLGVATGIVWGLAAAAAMLIAGAWIDLGIELTAALRVCFVAGSVVLWAGVAIRSAWRSVLAALPLNLAKRLDSLAGTGGQIAAGVELLIHGDAEPRREAPYAKLEASSLGAGLAQMAIARAAGLAGRVAPARAAPLSAMARPSLFASAVLAFAATVAVVNPRLAMTQWQRFTDPFGDHPPYSSLTFSVSPGDFSVIYGRGQDILADATGGAVDRLDLRLEAGDGSGSEVLPMFREPSGRWRATIANITQPGRYLVESHGSRSRRFAIGVITVPRIEKVRFRITPPAYVRRAALDGPLPQGGLAGLPGTQIEVWATSNRPLSNGKLSLTPAQSASTVELTPVSPGASEVTGRFEVRQSGTIELRITDTSSQSSEDAVRASISLLRDESPFIRILEPKAQSLATPDSILPVTLAAEDDYGIARVQLFRSLNDSRPTPLDLPLPSAAPPTRWSPRVELPLSAYGLRPGDVVKLFGYVEDNDPAGGKSAESPVVSVRIISQKDFERMVAAEQGMELFMSKYQQAERRLESLAEELRKLQEELSKRDADAPLSEAERQAMQKLAEQMMEAAREIEKAAKLDLPYDLDKALTDELYQLASAADAAGNAMADSAGQGLDHATAKSQLDKARASLEKARRKFSEEATEPLTLLDKVFPLMADEQKFVEIYERQRDLADRLASLHGRDGEDNPSLKARMRDLETEQRNLRNDLAQLLNDIDTHVTQLPEDPRFDGLRRTAEEFAAAVRASPADQQMGDAMLGLTEFSGTRGHENGKAAADTLGQFLSQCEGMGKEGGMCLKFSPKLAGSLGNTIEQLLGGMGLGSSGIGAGKGGYSMRSNSRSNVGLYGRLPGLGMTSSRTGTGSGPSGGRVADNGVPANKLQGDSGATRAPGATAGLGAAAPAQYRRRVGQYFQRVAEELETAPR